MSCDDCARAEVNPLTGRFTHGCFECTARALAGSPIFHESAQADAITPNYRAALQATFGAGWKEGHKAVQHWAERMAAANKGTT